jgi:hypothetical protein
MFNQRTVFVLGAGASEEMKFPLGLQLRDRIRAHMKLTDSGAGMQGPAANLLVHLARLNGNGPECIEAAHRIENGLPYFGSIDDFLDHRRDDSLLIQISKMAITQLILECETASPLSQVNQGRRVGDLGLAETWYFKFVKMLVKDRPRSQMNQLFENVTFITYNYDRSLEYYLMWAIADACDIPISTSIELIGRLSIHHVYGSLGHLPEFSRGYSVGYGNKRPAAEIEQIANNIRTYTESVADAGEQNKIRDAISVAEKVIFLGCGFHKQNIDILRPLEPLTNCDVIGTTFGASIRSKSTICARLASLYEPDPVAQSRLESRLDGNLYGRTCTQLFDEYSLGFTS